MKVLIILKKEIMTLGSTTHNQEVVKESRRVTNQLGNLFFFFFLKKTKGKPFCQRFPLANLSQKLTLFLQYLQFPWCK